MYMYIYIRILNFTKSGQLWFNTRRYKEVLHTKSDTRSERERKNSYTRSDNTNNKRAKNNHPKAFFDQLYQTLMGGYASYKIQPPAWPVHYRMAGIIATASVTALIVYCIPRIIMHFAFCIEVIMYKLHSYAF